MQDRDVTLSHLAAPPPQARRIKPPLREVTMATCARTSFLLVGILALVTGCVSTFGDSKYVGSVTLGGSNVGCPNALLASLPVVVKRDSRISGYGSGVYHQNGTDLNVISLHLELIDGKNTTVAVSNRVPITAPFGSLADPSNGNAFGAVSGVLQAGSDFLKVTAGNGTPFVAQPGNYALKLILEPASAPCPGQSFIGFISLSYLLLGTSP
jgi:hypothetical protein